MQNRTICWRCEKACGKCSWSDGTFTPVPGWKAEKVKLRVKDNKDDLNRYTDSYIVDECPQFDDDTARYNKKVKRNRWNSAPYLQEVTV